LKRVDEVNADERPQQQPTANNAVQHTTSTVVNETHQIRKMRGEKAIRLNSSPFSLIRPLLANAASTPCCRSLLVEIVNEAQPVKRKDPEAVEPSQSVRTVRGFHPRTTS
jgi:hypothetical protein